MNMDIPYHRILTHREFVPQDLRKRPENRLKLSDFSTKTNSCGEVRLAMNVVLGFERLCL
jgi:hypothetical protein